MKAKGKKCETKKFVYSKRLIYVGIAAIIVVISAIALFFIFYPSFIQVSQANQKPP